MNNFSNEIRNDITSDGSDSDLFGEGDEAFGTLLNEPHHTSINKDLEPTTLKQTFGKKHEYLASTDSEEVNEIELQRPENYFGFDYSDRIFLTLKLPKRLKVINTINSNLEANADNDMNIRGCIDKDGKIKTNSKLVSWSDGTYSLYINNRLSYDCILGTDKASIYDDTLSPKYKIHLGNIKQKLTIRPRSIETNRALKETKNRVMIPTTLQEINQSEIDLRRREHEFNTISSIKLQQRQTLQASSLKKKQMTSSFLEESSEEELV